MGVIVAIVLITGSTALHYHGLDRSPQDFDAIVTPTEYDLFLKRHGRNIVWVKDSKFNGKQLFVAGQQPIELEVADSDSLGSELLAIEQGFASLDTLYTLKMSHRFLKDSPHFKKTMDDIRELRLLGCTVPDHLRDWLVSREKETYNYSHPKLNQAKSDFFTDNVKYVYDHDTVHQAVKLFDVPAYELMKSDKAEVLCSRKKFDALPFEQQIASVLEESYVLALERHQIPNDFEPSPKTSFLIALQKVCTSITSGWWREFAWEHYEEAVSRYSDAYVMLFHQGVSRGQVVKCP